MRFDREAWVKLYRAESAQHRLMSLATRSLRDMILRFVEDDGTLLRASTDETRDLCRVLGAVTAADKRVVKAALDELIDIGYIQRDEGRLWIPKFSEAQMARTPEARRQAAWRETHGKTGSKEASGIDYGSIRRLRILDGDQCSYCQKTLDFRVGRSPVKAVIDHVEPRVHGGSDSEDNLVLACWHCNSVKGDRTLEELGMTLHCSRVVALRPGVTSNANGNAYREEKRREGEEIPQTPRRGLAGIDSSDIRQRSSAALRDQLGARSYEPHRWPEVVEAAQILHQGLGYTGQANLGQLMRDPGCARILELFDAGFTVDDIRTAKPKLLGHQFLDKARKIHAVTVGVLREILGSDGSTDSTGTHDTP